MSNCCLNKLIMNKVEDLNNLEFHSDIINFKVFKERICLIKTSLFYKMLFKEEIQLKNVISHLLMRNYI